MKYFVVEKLPGNAFIKIIDKTGQERRIPCHHDRSGPFADVKLVTKWLTKYARPNADYEIETVEDVSTFS